MNKRLTVSLAILLYALFTVAQTNTQPQGSGSKSDPYKVTSIENLNWIAINVNSWHQFFEGKYFVQINDIDATASATYDAGKGWKPIGDSTNFHFKGNYDGQGYAIDGLTVDRTSTKCVGLFGYIEGGTVENLQMTNSAMQGQHYVGCIAGISDGNILNCSSTGGIAANNYAGGIVGINMDTIMYSYSTTTVSANAHAGGIVGGNTGYIDQCYAQNFVQGIDAIGGFVGKNWGKIYNSYCLGTVSRSSEAEESIGGFVGTSYSGNIYYCYSIGQVEDQSGVNPTNKGFVGYRRSGYFTGCFVDTLASLQTESPTYYSKLLSTDAMQIGAPFATSGYDFMGRGGNNIWNIGNGRNNGYPYLQWQYPTDGVPILDLPGKVLLQKSEYNGGPEFTVTAMVTDMGSPYGSVHGICWSYTKDPTITDDKIDFGVVAKKDTNEYTITGLIAGETIYARAYIINDIDTVYSSSQSMYLYSIPAGTGTEQDPYLISSVEDLYWFKTQANTNSNIFLDAYFRQTKDIDLTPVKDWSAAGWDPIKKFSGTYDGAGYSLTNLYIKRSSYSSCGFFSHLHGEVKNLNISSAEIYGENYSGILAGRLSGSITQCHVSGSITGKRDCAGFVGLFNSGLIHQSSADVIVTGTTSIGGIAGNCYRSTLISQCFSVGEITGNNMVGGLVGDSQGEIKDCYTRANVYGLELNTYSNVYSFIGEITSPNIQNCYATGKVNFPNHTHQNNRGFGYLTHYSGNNLNGCFWDIETSEQTDTTITLAIGLPTSKMTDISTFIQTGWDFDGTGKENVWKIGNSRNDGYPYLAWEYPSDVISGSSIEPAINALEIDTISPTGSATFSCAITSLGKPLHSNWGICWSTTSTPSIADNIIEFGSADTAGVYSCTIPAIVTGDFTHVRVFITNTEGTFYSNTLTIQPPQHVAGSGTENDPYLISSMNDLYWLQYMVMFAGKDFTGKYFSQTADIDATETKKWNGGKGWLPLAGIAGHYNGNDHIIDNIYMNRPKTNNVGFLHPLAFDFSLKNLGLTNVDISGNVQVGGMSSEIRFCQVNNCYVTGIVRGASSVGGFTGENHYGAIEWCYADVKVEAKKAGGGFVGTSFCPDPSTYTKNCYAKGSVTRISGQDSIFGGLVGYCQGYFINNYTIAKVYYSNATDPLDKGFSGTGGRYTNVENSFYDSELTQQTGNDPVAEGLPTAIMKDQNFFEMRWWDFNGNNPGPEHWVIDPNKNDGYPHFSWQTFPATPAVNTKDTSDVTSSTIILNGELTGLGLSDPTAHGFCWAEGQIALDINNATVEDLGSTSSTGAFSNEVTPTDPCAKYHARAFATNSEGTAYGSEITFSLDTEKAEVTWDASIEKLQADPTTGKGTIPDYTTLLTVTDNCPVDNITISQSFHVGYEVDEGTKFAVIITATDNGGNKTFTTINSEVVGSPKQEVSLTQGWNLVSLNIVTDDMTIKTLFPNAISVKSADAFWSSNYPIHLNSLKELVAGQGYLVHNSQVETIIITGEKADINSWPGQLPQGWNIIGLPHETALARQYIPTVEYEAIKDFDLFYIDQGNQGDLDILEPGKAYFIKVK